MKTVNNIPRGIPFRPPEELQAQARRLRRWSLALVFATAILIVGASAAFVYFKNQTYAAAPPVAAPAVIVAAEEAPPVTISPAATPPGAAPPAATQKPAPSAPPLPKLTLSNLPGRDLSAKEKNPAGNVASASPQPGDARQRERFLEALGGLSAVHLYQSYLNIGLVADAVENETYTKTDAADLLQTIAELVLLVDSHLARLAQAGLEGEDQEAIDRIRALAAQLRVQTNSLLGYWATDDMEYVDRYHSAREQTWADLKDLLGIEE